MNCKNPHANVTVYFPQSENDKDGYWARGTMEKYIKERGIEEWTILRYPMFRRIEIAWKMYIWYFTYGVR